MKLGTWLLSLVQPFIAKILISLGFSLVTITGMNAILDQIKTQLVSGLGGMAPDMAALFGLAGGGTALGMIVGALTTKLLLWSIQNSVKILGVNPG